MLKTPTLQNPWKLFTVTLLLSLSTVILGAPFMRLVRNVKGSRVYWFVGLVLLTLFWILQMQPLAILVFAIWLNVGMQVELEQRQKMSLWNSGFLSTLITCLVSVFLTAMALIQKNLMNRQAFDAGFEFIATNMQKMNPQMQMDPKEILFQAPSVFVVFLILALFIGLAFEKKISIYFITKDSFEGLLRKAYQQKIRLLAFKVPDYLIWPALLSLLFSMPMVSGEYGSVVALNIVNIFVCIFFLQGLAVLESAFIFFKAGFFLRLLVFMLVFGYLFLAIGFLGFADYWLDLRGRMKKSSATKVQ